jgi:predicted dehydrogenase
MSDQRLRVGIVGVQPGRSWAARSHIPALHALSDTFEIAGIANSSRSSAEAAAAETGISRAFDNVAELVAAPEVDIVTVAVKVPPHFEIANGRSEMAWLRQKRWLRWRTPKGSSAWSAPRRLSHRKSSI